jgi:hypothetical protein
MNEAIMVIQLALAYPNSGVCSHWHDRDSGFERLRAAKVIAVRYLRERLAFLIPNEGFNAVPLRCNANVQGWRRLRGR